MGRRYLISRNRSRSPCTETYDFVSHGWNYYYPGAILNILFLKIAGAISRQNCQLHVMRRWFLISRNRSRSPSIETYDVVSHGRNTLNPPTWQCLRQRNSVLRISRNHLLSRPPCSTLSPYTWILHRRPPFPSPRMWFVENDAFAGVFPPFAPAPFSSTHLRRRYPRKEAIFINIPQSLLPLSCYVFHPRYFIYLRTAL